MNSYYIRPNLIKNLIFNWKNLAYVSQYDIDIIIKNYIFFKSLINDFLSFPGERFESKITV